MFWLYALRGSVIGLIKLIMKEPIAVASHTHTHTHTHNALTSMYYCITHLAIYPATSGVARNLRQGVRKVVLSLPFPSPNLLPTFLPSPSLPFSSLPSSPFPSSPLFSLRSMTLNPATGSGERCELPQRGLSPSRNRI